MTDLNKKYQALIDYIKGMGSAAVAFSSGVDSTLLLAAAHDALGDKVLAVTARSCSFPERELKEAVTFAKANGIEHVIVDSEELDIEGFSQNPVNRCYLCKSELFTKIRDVAEKKGIKEILEGSNLDDLGDYRPGLQAITELKVKSPLRHVGLTKEEIRRLSQQLGLPTWDKQSFACLASRFPYGEIISPEKLKMVEEAEQLLLDLGFRQVRVRHHNTLARIEIDETEMAKIIDQGIRTKINEKFKALGFAYTALDLKGYRTGSMNETLAK